MTDEQLAYELYPDFIDSNSNNINQHEKRKGFIAGCQHVRAEAETKGRIFAEWCAKSSWFFREVEDRWYMIIRFNILKEHDIEYSTTSELFASPEFESYYEERRNK